MARGWNACFSLRPNITQRHVLSAIADAIVKPRRGLCGTLQVRVTMCTAADVSDEDEGFGEGSVIEDGEGRRSSQGTAAVNLDFLNRDSRDGHLPPQTVLVRVLRELEDDFTHYKGYVGVYFKSLASSDSGSGRRIYTELADQYKMMDAASNVVKRNVLAQHLRDVIDVLEQR